MRRCLEMGKNGLNERLLMSYYDEDEKKNPNKLILGI